MNCGVDVYNKALVLKQSGKVISFSPEEEKKINEIRRQLNFSKAKSSNQLESFKYVYAVLLDLSQAECAEFVNSFNSFNWFVF